MFFGHLLEFGNKVKGGNKIPFGVSCSYNILSTEVSLHIVKLQNIHIESGNGYFILFDKIPILTIELPQRRFQTFPDILVSLAEKLIRKPCHPQN